MGQPPTPVVPSHVLAVLHELASDPGISDYDRLLLRAEAMLLTGRTLDAERAFTSLHTLPGISTRTRGIALDRLGDIAWWRGDFPTAASFYRQSLKYRPEDQRTRKDLARALWHMGARGPIEDWTGERAGRGVDVPAGSVMLSSYNVGQGVTEVFGLYVSARGAGVLPLQGCTEGAAGQLVTTGNLGTMALEACDIAWSLWKRRVDGRPPGIRIHSPQAAILKEGPSLGLAVFVLIGRILEKLDPSPMDAFTGELDLKGRVLPVGGIEQKTLAAYLSGCNRLFLPTQNVDDTTSSFAEVIDLFPVEHVFELEMELQV